MSDKALSPNANAFNIKIEDGSQNLQEIHTDINEIGKTAVSPQSVLSDGSIRGIEGGAVSINSSENTGDMTQPLQDARAKMGEDPH